jgi:cell division protein FtsL
MEEEARTAPPRAERDPFRLRPFPHEDVFFYCKKIDNTRLVREHDDRAHGACWSAIAGAALVLVTLTGISYFNVANTVAGYKLEALRAEERKLMDESRALDLQVAELTRPDRLVQLAQKRNLVKPSSGQVYHLDQPDGSTVAMAK